MAKALAGFSPVENRLVVDHLRLRRRIADLEALVARLQAENDALTDAQAQLLVEIEQISRMQPA